MLTFRRTPVEIVTLLVIVNVNVTAKLNLLSSTEYREVYYVPLRCFLARRFYFYILLFFLKLILQSSNIKFNASFLCIHKNIDILRNNS